MQALAGKASAGRWMRAKILSTGTVSIAENGSQGNTPAKVKGECIVL